MLNLQKLAVAAAAFFSIGSAAPVSEGTTLKQGQVVQDSYIITLRSNVTDIESHLTWVDGVHKRSLTSRDFSGVQKTYSGISSFKGYSGHFDEDTIAEIKNNPDVIAVEEDKVWVIDVTETKRDITTQDPATWGLGTISHRESGSEAYVYDDAAGDSTFGYVVDTGVLLTHEEFEGRAELGYTAFEGDEEDTVGHGTHVSGTIAGKTYGISKKAGIVAVKVFQGSSSSTSIIIEGYEWAVDDIVSKDRQNAAAINLSLGGPASEAFNNAVEAATEQGVITVVAAGNDGADASDYSPASAPSAITVGAVDSDWAIAEFSNYGSVLDIFAPGVDVLSSFIGGDDATDTLSGTSMATPHVVGLVLYALSVDGVKGVDEVVSHLKEAATSDAITGDLKESPNVLGNNGNSEQ